MLRGKTAIITGGGRGIGRAIALAYAENGANVCLAARSEHEINSVASEIKAMGRECVAIVCDVTQWTSVENMIEAAVAHFGRIDILVNNAGGGTERQPVGSDDPARWARVVEVNLMGTYHCCRAVLPYMKGAGSGTIINIGSGMGHQAMANNSSYSTSKAAVWMLTRTLALEVWPFKICVNELEPGPVYTTLTADVFKAGSRHPVFPSDMVKCPDDVVPMALFLATQPPTGPTGQSFSLSRRPV